MEATQVKTEEAVQAPGKEEPPKLKVPKKKKKWLKRLIIAVVVLAAIFLIFIRPMMSAGQHSIEDRAGVLNVPCPITLGVTVLTSMDADTLRATGVERPVADQVRALASQAREAGLSGVVASPQEAAMLRELLGRDAAIVTPGVRPAGAALGDQSRVATPAQAFADGASHIVVGRPITQAEDPVAAYRRAIKDFFGN